MGDLYPEFKDIKVTNAGKTGFVGGKNEASVSFGTVGAGVASGILGERN
jgi:hypothetical protein